MKRTYPTWLLLLVCLLGTFARADDPIERPLTAEERDHWAFAAPKRPEIPQSKKPGGVRNPIDAFIRSGQTTIGAGVSRGPLQD